MTQSEKNLKGIELEKEGKFEEAIALYLENVSENFDGSHPYTRLIDIYLGKNQLNLAKQIAERAIYVFENIVYYRRSDRIPKLNRYKNVLLDIEKKEREGEL